MSYLARRLLHALLLLAALSVVSFAFARLAPGDFYSEMRTDPRISGATIEALRQRAGLHRSFPAQYAAWAASLLHGDFGYSLAYQGPVAPILWQRVGATLLLTATATLLAWMLAIPLGVWNALRRENLNGNAQRDQCGRDGHGNAHVNGKGCGACHHQLNFGQRNSG